NGEAKFNCMFAFAQEHVVIGLVGIQNVVGYGFLNETALHGGLTWDFEHRRKHTGNSRETGILRKRIEGGSRLLIYFLWTVVTDSRSIYQLGPEGVIPLESAQLPFTQK